MEIKKYEKLTTVFFGLVLALLIINIVLSYMGYITALEAGLGEIEYSALAIGSSLNSSQLYWVEVVIFVLIFIGLLTKKRSLISIASILGIVFCILTMSGLISAFFLTISHNFPFSDAFSLVWRGPSKYPSSFIRFPLIYFNILLFILYYIFLMVISKSSASSSALGSGGIIVASLITVLRIVDLMKRGFPARRILPIILLVIWGACLGLGLFFFDKSKGITFSQSASKTSPSSNDVDGLIKLKDLLDRGIITQQEFDRKKKEIIDR